MDAPDSGARGLYRFSWRPHLKRIIPFLLSLVLLCFGIYYIWKADQEDSKKVSDLYAQVEPLERQRQELQQQLEKLSTSYALKTRDYGTIELLFPKPIADVYTAVYPIMREMDLVGVIGISASYLPESYGNMKKEEVQRLVTEGWGLCLVYERNWYNDFKSWYDNLVYYTDLYGLPRPTSVYFPNNDYQAEMEEQMIECGIGTVIVNAHDGRSSTVTDATKPIWLTGAMPWNYTGIATDVELLGRTDGANLCFVVDMGDPYSYPYTPWSEQESLADFTGDSVNLSDKAAFQKIIQSWKNMIYIESPLDDLETVQPVYVPGNSTEAMQQLYLESLTTDQQLKLPRFRVTTADAAKQYHVAADVGYQEIIDEQNQKYQEIQNQIDELDAQIRAKYDAFNQQQKGGIW